MPRKLLSLLLPLCLVLLVSACARSMMSTASVADAADGTCHANAGTYHLPKRLIHVTVSGEPTSYSLSMVRKGLVSDDETFCLDFLLSVFSDDRVGIKRSGTGLLQRIFTHADDKSKSIANAVIQATGDLVASSKAGGLDRLAQKQVSADNTPVYSTIDYDPFDEQAATDTRDALKPFGYCVYLDDRNDPYVPEWSPRLCGQQSEYHDTDPSYYSKEKVAAHKLMQHGVLYRPELSHRLVILRKNDPDSPSEAWHLAGTEYLEMPNRAPIFALGVNRAFFVTAETDVLFDNGLLKNVTVIKPSELNAFVDIPLYAAQVALSIPAATLNIFQNEAANRKELWQTNAELVSTLRKMRQDTMADQALAQGTITPGQRIAVAGGVAAGDGIIAAGAQPLAARSGESPALQRLSSCLDDETINATPEGRAQCFDAMKSGE